MILLKLALKEIRNNLRFTIFFVCNLALGLSGLVAIDSFKISVREALDMRAKGILSADLGVGARRALTDEELQITRAHLPTAATETRTFESFTMVAGPNASRLVEVKAIEPAYPFYGELELQKAGAITSTTEKDLFQAPRAWVFPELLAQLGLKVGEKMRIGSVDFEISDLIVRDSSGVGAGFSFAPPLYVAYSHFQKTGLVRVGSTGYYSHLFRLPPETNPETLAETLNSKLTDPGIQVTTSRNASEQVGRLLGYLGDYLGLAALVAMFLMALGQIYLYRGYLVKRYRDMAILKSLGLEDLRVLKLYLLHIILLGLLTLIPCLLFALGILPLLSGPAQELVNVDVSIRLHVSTLLLLLAVSGVGSLFVCGPLLFNALQVKPRELLQPYFDSRRASTARLALLYLPAIFSYYAISIWLAKSWKTGSLFFALFAVSVGALFAIGYGALKWLEFRTARQARLARHTTPRAWALAVRSLVREKAATLAAFLSLGLGILLANLIPILEGGILSEVQTPDKLEQPSLFLFDIQEEQTATLQALLTKNGAQLMQMSPMIRARMARVNGENFEKRRRGEEAQTREEENENRFRNRGFNITYRDQLTPSERLVSGPAFHDPSLPTDLPKISLEERFADRLKVHVGDRLTFDIQGIEVEGRVVNLRKVRWTSFQPNFFIQFQEGVLNEAPKTFLATLGPLDLERKSAVQNAVVRELPNISIIDVSRIVERMTGIISQMGIALQAMALFAMVVGLTILFSIASHQVYERRMEINLFKILGADFPFIRRLFLYEFTTVTVAAVFFGTGVSLLVGFFLAREIFDSAFAPSWNAPLWIAALAIAATISITLTVVRRVLQVRPRELLQSLT